LGQKQNSLPPSNMIGTILQNIPPEAEITRIEFEGPRIALYTKKPGMLHQNNYIISDIVNTVRKRVVVRTDKSIRKAEEEAKEIIERLLPSEVSVSNYFFDEALGEVILETEKPQLLTQECGFNNVAVLDQSGWKPRVRSAPRIPSTTFQAIYYALKTGVEDRERFLKETGENIFREKLGLKPEITIHTLGAFREVGRSSILVSTPESRVLIDCGIHPGAKNPCDAYPRIDWVNIGIDDLDAVIISHGHMDHHAFLPTLLKYGYDGPIYCTEPTLPLMTLIQTDYIKVASMEGSGTLYDLRDVRETIKHCITLPYGVVTDVSPDIKLVFNNAGHILGSATVHLHIGEGAHNIVYTGDFKFARTMLFDGAAWNFPRVETLIMESTYGSKEDIMPSREEVELNLVNTINEVLSAGGKVLIPVPAVGRAQEILLVLDQYMREGKIHETPIYLEGMISEATAIHMAYPDYLAKELKMKLLETGENPFLSSYFTVVDHPENRTEALREGPAIIIATSGMLEGGPVMQYFEELALSEKNKIVFVSYQIPGTLGRRILDGARQVSLISDDGKIKIVDIRCKVDNIEGFSGHSDYNQLMRYVGRLRPKLKQVIVNHGERRKVENVAYAVSRIFRIPAQFPDVMESIRLY
jgi:KH/beta-lactamase-domain protein